MFVKVRPRSLAWSLSGSWRPSIKTEGREGSLNILTERSLVLPAFNDTNHFSPHSTTLKKINVFSLLLIILANGSSVLLNLTMRRTLMTG